MSGMNGEEETPLEVNIDGNVSDVHLGFASNRPSIGGRRLTNVSQKYDRDGKGYLDETEFALRRLDSTNKGFLEMDKVYVIMESLQREQQNSSELMAEIRKEHKKSMSFKRGMIAMTAFAVLLALSNIGTSFAAARLAQDMKVVGRDLVSMDGTTRVGTTSKSVEYSMTEADNGSDARHLQAVSELACEGKENRTCTIVGQATFTTMVALHQEFCSAWPNGDWLKGESYCLGGGVESLYLSCNGVRTKILGGLHMPNKGPSIDTFGFEYMIFPTQDGDYKGQVIVFDPVANGSCVQDIDLDMYCPTSGANCIVYASFDPTCNTYDVTLCG